MARRPSTLPDDDAKAFLTALEHPHRTEIGAVRDALLAADPSVRDGVKWNSVSFRTTEWFATVHLRAKRGVQLIFHFGAKARGRPRPKIELPTDAAWLGDDRCSVILPAGKELAARLPELKRFVRAWIAHV